MKLPAVFEIENDTPNDAAAPKSRHSRIKIKFAMRAIGAIKRGSDRADKWLRTSPAKRRNDARDLGIALGAKIFVWLNVRPTAGTQWRIKQ
jgi:hypothetical protein